MPDPSNDPGVTETQARELGQKARIGHVRYATEGVDAEVDGLWWTDNHVWVKVGQGSGSCDCCGEWQYPELINDWINAGEPYCDIAYRLCEDVTGDELQFMGHIANGASGSIAFYLDEAFWPHCDMSTVTDIITTPLGIAQIYVAAADGAVTITTIV